MTNPYYNATGTPANRASGSSAAIRAEFTAIAAGFDAINTALTTTPDILYLTRSAGQFAYNEFRTGSLCRWRAGVNSDSETGSNAGSNYFIGRCDDAGSGIGVPLEIDRKGGFFKLGSVTAAPTSNLGTAGGYLYVESGALKFRGGSGTVTTLGVA